jgi:hypothetical protein
VLFHESVGNLAVFAESMGGADFVEAHEPRVPSDVAGGLANRPASSALLPDMIVIGLGLNDLGTKKLREPGAPRRMMPPRSVPGCTTGLRSKCPSSGS